LLLAKFFAGKIDFVLTIASMVCYCGKFKSLSLRDILIT